MWSVPLLGIVAKIGLKGEPSEREQRRNDGWFVKGMVRMEVLHPAAVPDDVVAQLQVIMMPRRLIAGTATTARLACEMLERMIARSSIDQSRLRPRRVAIASAVINDVTSPIIKTR